MPGQLGTSIPVGEEEDCESVARNVSVDSDTNKRNAGFFLNCVMCWFCFWFFGQRNGGDHNTVLQNCCCGSPFLAPLKKPIENSKLLQEKSILGIWCCCCLLTVL
jgi:hypothetical protein